jgi:hypothetical protein
MAGTHRMSDARFEELSSGIPDYDGPKLEEYTEKMRAAHETLDIQPQPEWKPPFDGNLIENVSCPRCEDECVHARVDSSADPRPAYCGNCHANLELDVYETFGNAVEVVDDRETLLASRAPTKET